MLILQLDDVYLIVIFNGRSFDLLEMNIIMFADVC